MKYFTKSEKYSAKFQKNYFQNGDFVIYYKMVIYIFDISQKIHIAVTPSCAWRFKINTDDKMESF